MQPSLSWQWRRVPIVLLQYPESLMCRRPLSDGTRVSAEPCSQPLETAGPTMMMKQRILDGIGR